MLAPAGFPDPAGLRAASLPPDVLAQLNAFNEVRTTRGANGSPGSMPLGNGDATGLQLSEMAFTFTPTVPPSVPAGLTALSVGNQVSLSRLAASNAVTYHVKRALISGGPCTNLATVKKPVPALRRFGRTGGILLSLRVPSAAGCGTPVPPRAAFQLTISALPAGSRGHCREGTSPRPRCGSGRAAVRKCA